MICRGPGSQCVAALKCSAGRVDPSFPAVAIPDGCHDNRDPTNRVQSREEGIWGGKTEYLGPNNRELGNVALHSHNQKTHDEDTEDKEPI